MDEKVGILLVNLGTPRSPAPKDVRRYLIEFLTDGRVIDIPWSLRQLLVRNVIVPKRYRESAKAYQSIWSEQGSPLLVYGEQVAAALTDHFDENTQIELAMRYQEPSIEAALEKMRKVDHLIVFPLFPQYASATTGSIHEKVMDHLKSWRTLPKLTFINHYATHRGYIDAFYEVGKNYPHEEFDAILFSFHGLPEKHLVKSDVHNYCLKEKDCCSTPCSENKNCYAAQCHATANALAGKLGIPKEKWQLSFQSRLGNDPWVQPYTNDCIEKLAQEKTGKLLVFCPAFVADCLETLEEIGIQYAKEFEEKGGGTLTLVPSLNATPKWIEGLASIVSDHLGHSRDNGSSPLLAPENSAYTAPDQGHASDLPGDKRSDR